MKYNTLEAVNSAKMYLTPGFSSSGVSGNPPEISEDIDLIQLGEEELFSLAFFGDMPEILFITYGEWKNLSSTLKSGTRTRWVVVMDGGEVFPETSTFGVEIRRGPLSWREALYLCRKAASEWRREEKHNREMARGARMLKDALNDQESLIHIGRSLSLEKDPNKLLRTILMLSKKITGADAGSIFIVEDGGKKQYLRFKYSHTFSKKLDYEEFIMPLDTKSIAGYVGVTGKVLNIPDAYALGEDSPVGFNTVFDEKHGYRTKSMLVLPMKNHLGNIIGVIQLINCKEVPGEEYTGNEAFEVTLAAPEDYEKKVIPFNERYETLMEAIAGQAAIALENNRMLIQIERQFEEFVKASVSAIESRDPATSGHSFRVAGMCVNTARAVSQSQADPWKQISYSETELKAIEFAGLLHDFGKVYIDPNIFLKGKKLFPQDFAYLKMRLQFLYRSIELDNARNVSGFGGGMGIEEKLNKIKEIINIVTLLNEPRVTDEDPEETIRKVLTYKEVLSCCDLEGEEVPLLNEQEIVNLNIKRGSLNPVERKEIESHVNRTYDFVSKIPWPKEYADIPAIALKHHEKLDGSGYPMRLKGKEAIPLPARIMAIADIFDALNASDRPYKKAVPLEKVLEILREEGRQGKLDEELIELFIQIRAWEGLETEESLTRGRLAPVQSTSVQTGAEDRRSGADRREVPERRRR